MALSFDIIETFDSNQWLTAAGPTPNVLEEIERFTMSEIRDLLQRHVRQMGLTAAVDPTVMITDEMEDEFALLAHSLWVNLFDRLEGVGLGVPDVAAMVDDAIETAKRRYVDVLKALIGKANPGVQTFGEFVFAPDYVPGTGTRPPAPYQVQMGDVRTIISALGGDSPDPTVQLSTGITGGRLLNEVLESNGVQTDQKLWLYGETVRRPFNGHMQIDGLVFTNWDDEALEIAPQDYWLRTDRYRPGDHWGCACVVVPYIPNFGAPFTLTLQSSGYNPRQPRDNDGRWVAGPSWRKGSIIEDGPDTGIPERLLDVTAVGFKGTTGYDDGPHDAMDDIRQKFRPTPDGFTRMEHTAQRDFQWKRHDDMMEAGWGYKMDFGPGELHAGQHWVTESYVNQVANNGHQHPSPHAIQHDDKIVLLDGHHRVTAAWLKGERIEVDVFDPSGPITAAGCQDASCAPPPHGTGGSRPGHGASSVTGRKFHPTSDPGKIKHLGSLAVANEMTSVEKRNITEELSGENQEVESPWTYAMDEAAANLGSLRDMNAAIAMQMIGIYDRYQDDYDRMDRVQAVMDRYESEELDQTGFHIELEKLTGVSVASGLVNYMNRAWATDATGSESVAAHIVASRQFDLGVAEKALRNYLPSSTLRDADEMVSKTPKTIHALVASTYRLTQETLEANGINEVVLYRGVQAQGSHKKIIAQPNPLSSWSTDEGIALRFATDRSSLYHAKIPASQIYALANLSGTGALDEWEAIVIGKPVTASLVSEALTASAEEVPTVLIDQVGDPNWLHKKGTIETFSSTEWLTAAGCQDASCAPPPHGTGGSRPSGGGKGKRTEFGSRIDAMRAAADLHDISAAAADAERAKSDERVRQRDLRTRASQLGPDSRHLNSSKISMTFTGEMATSTDYKARQDFLSPWMSARDGWNQLVKPDLTPDSPEGVQLKALIKRHLESDDPYSDTSLEVPGLRITVRGEERRTPEVSPMYVPSEVEQASTRIGAAVRDEIASRLEQRQDITAETARYNEIKSRIQELASKIYDDPEQEVRIGHFATGEEPMVFVYAERGRKSRDLSQDPNYIAIKKLVKDEGIGALDLALHLGNYRQKLHTTVVNEVLNEIRPMGGTLKDTPKHRKPKMGLSSNEQVTAAISRMPTDWLEQSDAYPRRIKFRQTEGRAHYADVKTSNSEARPFSELTLDGSISTATHEMAHRMEYAVPSIRGLEEEFYTRRTRGDSLKHLGRGYGRNEMTKEDQFHNPYVGKDYQGKAYEVMSMGYEGLYSLKTWNTMDADYQAFVLGVITNAHRSD